MTVIIGEADNRLIGGVLGMINTDTLDRGESGGTSVGVVGLAGTSEATDDWNGNVESNGQPVTAAVLGAVPIVSQTGRPASTCLGFIGGFNPVNQQQTGAYGEGDTGVFGQSSTGNGVFGFGHHSVNAAISAVNDAGGIGLYAESRGGQHNTAAHFNGNVEVVGDLNVSGSLNGTLGQRISQLEAQVKLLLDRLDSQHPNFAPANVPTLFIQRTSNLGQLSLSGENFTPRGTVTIRVEAINGNGKTLGVQADGNGRIPNQSFQDPLFNASPLFVDAADESRGNKHDLTGKVWTGTNRVV